MVNLLIYVIFIFAFFANSLIGYRLIPPQASLVTEAIIYLLFLYSLLYSKAKRYSWHLWYPACFFLLVTLCSIVANNYFSLRPLMSLRVILRFYLFYLALINIELDEAKIKNINKLLVILFIIQLPAQAYKFNLYGISEMTIGTYDTHGGSLTAIIPIVALGYLAGYYFFFERKLSYVLLATAFILFGILGAKRMLLFIYPLSFMGIYFLVYVIDKKKNILKHIAVITCIAVLSITVGAVILKTNITFNPERKVGGSIDLDFAMKYTKWYTTHSNKNSALGRLPTTIMTFKQLYNQGDLLFGFGPGSITGSVLDRGRYIDQRTVYIRQSYGKTGLVYIVAEYGVLGLIAICLLFLTFVLLSWRWYRSEKDPYWKAFAMGSFVFAAYLTFIFFCYSTVPIEDDTIPPVFYYAMAVMYIKMKQITQEKPNVAKVEVGTNLRHQL